MALGSQFLLLMWKNWTLQKRKKCVTVFEILLPVSFALLLVLIRSLVKRETFDNVTSFPSLNVKDVNFEKGPGLITKTLILYTPKYAVIDDVMNVAKQYLPERPYINDSTLQLLNHWTLKSFTTEKELEDFYKLNYKRVWAGLQFDPSASNGTSLSKNVRYQLRVSPKEGESKWRTGLTYPFFQTTGYRNDDADGGTPDYYLTGFLALQVAVDKAITHYFNSSSNFDVIELSIRKMPYAPFIKDNFLTVMQQNFPLLLVLGFILAALQTTKSIVYEKEKKLKEAMKLMGMNSFVYWLSWFVKDLIYLLIVIGIYTILFVIPIADRGKILPNSDPSLLFVFLLCYVISILAFCFMVSTVFNKANAGAFAGGALFYGFYIPYYFLQDRYETMSRSEKMSVCLLNNMGMAFGLNTVGFYEGTGDGAQWNNFHKPATVDDNFSLLDAMIMLIADSAIYLLITWYIDGVHPGEYGVPLPWYFPVSKTYWCGQTRRKGVGSSVLSDEDKGSFERDPVGLEIGISINKLRKVFGSGKKKKVAVAGTTLNMYEGQITALLGHNGAGKTTTMSMLTGFLPPTSGSASVNGYDIVDNIQGVRESLGLCPQHNILFDTMTVEEHLYFFAVLKGCPKDRVQNEIDNMIRVLDIEPKRHQFSSTLSGGQKRKLSVGIALIADSKVVILDEPTSGMDPAARRQTWDILQKFKKDRTMVLSTHFMDEADLLGDRIAIMAEGVVKCCGTSLFLKKLYGAGYHLIIVKGKDCDVPKLTSLIQRHIQSAELESEISAELSYILPFHETAKFEKMFYEIEEKSKELGLTSFGTSATTMEEVFLKVGTMSSDEEEMNEVCVDGKMNPNYGSIEYMTKNGHGSIAGNDEITNGKPGTENIALNIGNQGSFIGFNSVLRKNTGFVLAYQQLCGMFVKKLVHSWRNRTVILVQTILPVLFVIMALSVEKAIPKAEDDPALPLDLRNFQNVKAVSNTGQNASSASLRFGSQYSSSLQNHGYEVIDYQAVQSKYSNLTDFFVTTSKDIGQNVFKKQYILAGDFEPVNNTGVNATAYFNGEPYHSVAISLTYMMDSMLKYFTDDSHSISTTNFPFPRPIDDSSRGLGYALRGTGFTVAFCVLFGMAFLSTSFIIFLIKEKSTGAKHLQKVSGVSSVSFWFSNFVWDMINYVLPVLLILACFAAFQTDAYTNDNRLGLIFFCFMIYGWACLPSVYLLHYLFKTPASGMVMVSLLNILTGLATMMAVFILEIPDLDIPDVGKVLDWVFAIFLPNHCLGQTLLNIYTNYGYKETCITLQYEKACANPNTTFVLCCRDKCTSNCFFFEDNYLSLTTPGCGKYVLFMGMQGFLYFTLVFLVEYGVFERLLYKMKSSSKGAASVLSRQQSMYDEENEDSDVLDEKRRINETDLQQLFNTDSIVLKNLSKSYDHFRAVKDVSIGIPQQECFGLLGQNGAGKTSIFKMLTGDQLVTNGNAYLNTYDIQQHLLQVQQNVGYCPQFDALIDQMTGRETLTMYARLRGVEEDQIKGVVTELLDIMMLRKYADRQCGTYSGGNKRKLSTAIALVGDPPFILLDEPTTGMDPGARRQLWNVLSQIRASGRTLILTSHSMEECDALCTKIAIMVNGRFKCLGSSQHLKNKYGHGYTLIVRVGLDNYGFPSPSEPLREFIKYVFPDSQIFDDHQGYIHFQIPDSNVPLARVFGAMEEAKGKFNIEDYSVHQTTLEQVFLTFTRNQIPPKEDKKGFFSFMICCR